MSSHSKKLCAAEFILEQELTLIETLCSKEIILVHKLTLTEALRSREITLERELTLRSSALAALICPGQASPRPWLWFLFPSAHCHSDPLFAPAADSATPVASLGFPFSLLAVLLIKAVLESS